MRRQNGINKNNSESRNDRRMNKYLTIVGFLADTPRWQDAQLAAAAAPRRAHISYAPIRVHDKHTQKPQE
jgi:hypothetical protein